MTDTVLQPAAILASPASRSAALALLRAIVRHHLSRVGLVIIAVLCFLAIFAPVLAPYSPLQSNAAMTLKPPSA